MTLFYRETRCRGVGDFLVRVILVTLLMFNWYLTVNHLTQNWVFLHNYSSQQTNDFIPDLSYLKYIASQLSEKPPWSLSYCPQVELIAHWPEEKDNPQEHCFSIHTLCACVHLKWICVCIFKLCFQMCISYW